jgi:hypothetical protein
MSLEATRRTTAPGRAVTDGSADADDEELTDDDFDEDELAEMFANLKDSHWPFPPDDLSESQREL